LLIESTISLKKGFVKSKPSQIFPPMMQITSFAISILVLVLFLSICIICRVQTAKKKTKLKKTPQFAGPPIYYRYSPANSMDYLGNYYYFKLKKFCIFKLIKISCIFLKRQLLHQYDSEHKFFFTFVF
jgi:hypothetical protein